MNFKDKYINWDANACIGISAEHYKLLQDALESELNPSSIHSGGQSARAAIEAARLSVASLCGNANSIRVVFTSGATEANNTICLMPLWGMIKKQDTTTTKGHILTSQIEHPSVLEPLKRLEQAGFEVTYLTPQQIEQCATFVQPNTLLVTIMAANNETGHIYNLSEQFKIIKVRYPQIIIHSDAVQVAGKLPIKFSELNVDVLTISAHKMGGLKGVGALVMHKHFMLEALLQGGAQELRYRAGTENVIGIVSFGIVAASARKTLDLRYNSMLQSRTLLRNEIKRLIPEAHLLFADDRLLPNTISLHFAGIPADDLVVALDLEGIYCSSGSACASGKPLPSHVLMAYGLSENTAREVLRISVTGQDDTNQLMMAVNCLASCVSRFYTEKSDHLCTAEQI